MPTVRDTRKANLLLVVKRAGSKAEQIELLELGQAGIHVAEYLTALPPRHVLEARFHAAIRKSRERLENRASD